MTTLRNQTTPPGRKSFVVAALFDVAALLFVFLLFSQGCGPLIRKVEIGWNYDFAKNRTVGIYVRSTGRDSLDRSFSAVAELDFISLGYQVVDYNQLLREHRDSLGGWRGPLLTAEDLLLRSYLPQVNAIAIWNPRWDSSMIFPESGRIVKGSSVTYSGFRVQSLSSILDLFDAANGSEALSLKDLDTTRLYRVPGEMNPSAGEFPWQLAARQLTRQLASIPACSVIDTLPPGVGIPVVFDVHADYRKKFPSDWRIRLTRRLFYASDLFRRQFNIGFELRGFVESDRQFDESIEHTLQTMKDSTKEDDEAIHIGVTVDPNLTWHWRQRTHIGYAYSLFPEMVVVSQPILPGLGNWSSIDEAITLVHELGHIFGAVHASSGASVMHPTSGSMAFLFDKLNENIIDSMKTGFLSESRAQRFEHYLRVISSLRKQPDCKNTAGIVAYAANASGYLQWADNQQRHPGSISTSTDGAGAALKIEDPALKDAIDGYIQYKELNYDKASEDLAKAVDEDPDFGEARVYYYLTLEKLGKSADAAPQLEKANQMHMAWLIDEK